MRTALILGARLSWIVFTGLLERLCVDEFDLVPRRGSSVMSACCNALEYPASSAPHLPAVEEAYSSVAIPLAVHAFELAVSSLFSSSPRDLTRCLYRR